MLLAGAADARDTHSALSWLALAGEAAWLAGDAGRPVELGQLVRGLAPAQTVGDQADRGHAGGRLRRRIGRLGGRMRPDAAGAARH